MASSSPSTHRLLSLVALLLLFLSIARSETLSATPNSSRPKPKAILLPVRKDAATLQYTTTIRQRTPLVPVKLTVDLGAVSSWVNCEGSYISSSYKPLPCKSKLCRHPWSGSCTRTCYEPPKPGCNNNTCDQFVSNSFIPTAYYTEMATDTAVFRSTDGKNPGRTVSIPGGIVFSCGFTVLLQGLSKNAQGMVGLGRSAVSLPAVLSSAFGFPNKFAMCLSSTTRSRSVIVFGDGPYFLQPGKEVSQFLTYTPLILNPVSTVGLHFLDEPSTDYFINVTGVKVNGKAVPLNLTLLKINDAGNGGTKLSTVDPYTVLETSIYRAVTRAFLTQGKYLKRIGSVKPFKYCFNATGVGSTRVGPAVPQIELLLGGGSWIIFGANSMVFVGSGDVMCLGIVDGGAGPMTSIVIGGYQLEDNLVQIDMVKKRLGFTSSLLFFQTTCANFNFTVV